MKIAASQLQMSSARNYKSRTFRKESSSSRTYAMSAARGSYAESGYTSIQTESRREKMSQVLSVQNGLTNTIADMTSALHTASEGDDGEDTDISSRTAMNGVPADAQERLAGQEEKDPITVKRAAMAALGKEKEVYVHQIRQQCVLYIMNLLFYLMKEDGNEDALSALTGENASSISGLLGGFGSETGFGSTMALNYQSYQAYEYTTETEQTSFQTQGTVKTADGKEIPFQLDVRMSSSFQQYYEESGQNVSLQMIDPLVINLDGNIASFSDQTMLFDLDSDGTVDNISRLDGSSGYLALDKNEDGKIKDGSELFGASSGNGFQDLAGYDQDKNGWIDENDAVWDKLKIWVQGESGEGELYTLKEKGVGAICLTAADTDFMQGNEKSGEKQGKIRQTGLFLYENGTSGTTQQVDVVSHRK